MSRGSAIVPPGLESLALTVRKTKQPAVGDAHSAGFAIRSPRGMGEPRDYAPRSSQHLSWIPICRAEGSWQVVGQEAVPHDDATGALTRSPPTKENAPRGPRRRPRGTRPAWFNGSRLRDDPHLRAPGIWRHQAAVGTADFVTSRL